VKCNMAFRRKAKKAFRKYATKRVAKRIGKKVVGKFIPGYNVYSTVDDVFWLGSKGYNLLKKHQLQKGDVMIDNNNQSSRLRSSGKRKRYGIDDWY